jgi:branched-chain amino acid transport system ATP-binding protein
MSALLECKALTGGRGPATAFRGIDLAVPAGTIFTLLGPNGAGKTTLLLTLAGLLPARAGTVHAGGRTLRNGRAAAANKAGIVLVPDNRSLFTTLTVEENLKVARRRGGRRPMEVIRELFPALADRRHLPAGALSGGEQQMLAIARALIQQPRVLLVDELSMGLAPLIVQTLFQTVHRVAKDHGCAVVLVEQHINLALEFADEAAVLNRGTIVLRAPASELAGKGDRLKQAYFGTQQPVTQPDSPASA